MDGPGYVSCVSIDDPEGGRALRKITDMRAFCGSKGLERRCYRNCFTICFPRFGIG
jgi:hypothetical protein